jgi:hypothetical protein
MSFVKGTAGSRYYIRLVMHCRLLSEPSVKQS